jgi:DNA-binding NarL/FixJ family response regulator
VRTLLVDDNPDILQLLRMTFAFHEGVRVCASAVDGKDAVAAFRALRPDVIVMDISMPVMNGIEAARQILAADPDARIVLYSADLTRTVCEQAAAIGVLQCVDKRDIAWLPELVLRLAGRVDQRACG